MQAGAETTLLTAVSDLSSARAPRAGWAGLGIGVTIVPQRVALHGTVSASSEGGNRGTVVRAECPVLSSSAVPLRHDSTQAV